MAALNAGKDGDEGQQQPKENHSAGPENKQSGKSTSLGDQKDTDEAEKPTKPAEMEEDMPGNEAELTPLTPARAKVLLDLIRSLRRMKASRPFNMPVDPGVPHYYEIIKEPMDLRTMERKICKDIYETEEEFVYDFDCIVINCHRFNGYDHPISVEARLMNRNFRQLMSSLPGEDD